MTPNPHIDITPETCSGAPRIKGTRVRVQTVVQSTEQGLSPDEIVAAFPQISLADVYAALAFYFDNKPEMDRLIESDAEFAESVRQTVIAGAAELSAGLSRAPIPPG